MQKNKKKEEIKITLENCEGYSKLHNKYSLNQYESNKMKKNIKKSLVITVIAIPLSVVFAIVGVEKLIVTLVFSCGVFTPAIVFSQNLYSIEKKHEKDVALQYPDINTNVSHDELEETLKMTGILKYKSDEYGKIHEIYDIKGYKNCILANQIKKEMLEEQAYKKFENDFNVSNKEMDKVKVKVKTMVRK